MSESKPDPKHRTFLPIVRKEGTPLPEPTPSITPSPPSPSPTATPEPTPGVTPTPPPGTTKKVVIDPITRIEGHLRIEVQVENGQVTDAWGAGMMFRGIELLLPGRDPRDAWVFTQRICGV